jgi:hypothetical protein
LVGCGVPAILYYCVQAGRAEVIGANLWAVGAVVLAIGMAGGLIVAGLLGQRLSRVIGRPDEGGTAQSR